MDELAPLASMRADVPADLRYDSALQALNAEINGSAKPARSRRRPIVLSAVLAGAVAAATVVTITDLNSGNDRHAPPSAIQSVRPKARLVAVTTPLDLANNATLVASGFPIPSPSQWIYTKVETTTSHAPPGGAMAQDPGTHTTRENWARVDFKLFASMSHGKLLTVGGLGGSPYGWPSITYAYLASLPTDPDALLAQIRHNLATEPTPDHGKTGDPYVFESILALVENYQVLPPQLNAALYGVLARLKTVRLGHTKDLAGRPVLSLYEIDEGYLKDEILINPTTYAYAGQKRSVVRIHSDTGLDGTLHFRKGEVLADEAVLVSKIVNSPGRR